MFLSAAEIAAEMLPGLPTVERAVKRNAVKGGWCSRPRKAKGGGLEYAVESLPAAARAAYVGRHIAAIEIPCSIAREAAAEPNAVNLTGNAASARDARLIILGLADRVAETAGVGHKRADRQFCDLYKLGQLEIAPWIRDEVKRVTPRTLAYWRAHAKAGRKSKLAVDRAAARRGTGVLDRANSGAIKTFILALIAKQPQLTAHHIRALVADRFPVIELRSPPGGSRVAQGGASGAEPTTLRPEVGSVPTLSLPPIRTFQATLKAWRISYRVELESIRNPDGFKSSMRFSARVANPASRLNEVWQIDASPADMLTTDGRRPTIYACVDVYSRRLIVLVTETPRAAAVGLLIRKAILAWGVPERIKTDNGSDFIARTTQRLFAGLQIEHEKSRPFSPEQKGHVERVIGTLQRGLMRTLPGFVGHSVADRKVIENRKAFSARLGETPEDMFQVDLSNAQLQQRCDEWCKDVYGNKAHESLKGLTPFAVAAMAPGKVRRITDLRDLDMLLAPIAGKDGLRTVTKTGLRIHGAHYLGGFLNVGDSVLVRMDEADMGRAYVFEADGEAYLGEVVSPELAGIDPAKAIAAARGAQKQLINDRMADVRKQARKIRAADMAPAIHRQALLDAGTLIEFPRVSGSHDTPALAAARDAHTPAVAHHSEAITALAAQLRAEDAAPAATVKLLRNAETAHQRWNRARAIEAQVARKEFVDADQLLWLGAYREGHEYRGFFATYGEAAQPDEESRVGDI